MTDKIPKVFISYSWTSESYQNRIIQIASKLRNDGIDVLLDVWELKEGHDKYVFMEKCVSDDSIDRVLIFSDKCYTEKANNRSGGVGDETSIISPELYGKHDQEKFITVLMEKDDAGEPYIPHYLKSRMYKDLTGDNFEKQYRELVALIYDVPVNPKPSLGKRPAWLDSISDGVNHLSIESREELQNNESFSDFIDKYIESLIPFYKENYHITDNEDGSFSFEYLDDFKEILEYRNIYLDVLVSALKNNTINGDLIGDSLERLYNALANYKTFRPDAQGYSVVSLDIFKLHIWELFITTICALLHYKKYDDIYRILFRTYYLNDNGSSVNESTYRAFYYHSDYLEYQIKPKTIHKNKYTLSGHLLCNERTYGLIFSKESISQADLLLYQLYPCLKLPSLGYFNYWFPKTYVYNDYSCSLWKQLKSHRKCVELLPLFGVSNIEDFKKAIELSKDSGLDGYGFEKPPIIMNYVSIDSIATLP